MSLRRGEGATDPVVGGAIQVYLITTCRNAPVDNFENLFSFCRVPVTKRKTCMRAWHRLAIDAQLYLVKNRCLNMRWEIY